MSERMLLDISTLAKDYPVQRETKTMPDGHTMVEELWDRERLLATLEAAKEIDIKGREVVYYGLLSPCWALFAVDNVLKPPKSYHDTHYLDNLEAEIRPLPIGEARTEGGIEFKLAEDGDDIYLKMFCDTPFKPGERPGHNYDYTKLEHVSIPPIPSGKHLFLSADGATFILLSAAKAYAPLCKSVSLSFFHDRERDDTGEHRLYTCAYTTTDEIQIFDRRRMYKDWDYIPEFPK